MSSIGPVQAVPAGLLSLFALKQLGRNPATLNDELTPVVELLELYCASIPEIVTGISAAVNAAQNWYFGITIPQGEIWFVHSLHCRASLVAGEALTLNVGFAIDRALAQPPLHPYSSQVLRNATQTVPGIFEYGCQPRMWHTANTVFGANVYQLTTAAAIELTSELIITRLKV